MMQKIAKALTLIGAWLFMVLFFIAAAGAGR